MIKYRGTVTIRNFTTQFAENKNSLSEANKITGVHRLIDNGMVRINERAAKWLLISDNHSVFGLQF